MHPKLDERVAELMDIIENSIKAFLAAPPNFEFDATILDGMVKDKLIAEYTIIDGKVFVTPIKPVECIDIKLVIDPDVKEQEDPNCTWRIIPVEGVRCPARCSTTSVKEKSSCNWHDCPYNGDGDDGYF